MSTTSTTSKKKFYRGIIITGLEDATPGTVYALIRVNPERGEERYELHDTYGRTNQSHEIRERGWLGSTNNVSRHAEGCVLITPANKIRVVTDDALYQSTDEDT